MSLSPSPSRTSLVAAGAAVLAVVATGCGGGDQCGPGSASMRGLTVTGPEVTLTYGALTSGLNNDCPASNAPAGVVSLTIFGTQALGGGAITLCISRPDLLAKGSQELGHDAAPSAVRIVDLNADADICFYTIDRSKPITGTATASGLCDNGNDPAGFALTLDGTLTLSRTCDNNIDDTVQVTLNGTNAVGTVVPF